VAETSAHDSGSVNHWRGRGDDGVETVGSAQTGPVRTAEPLKARDTVAFSQCMALGVQQPPIGGLSGGNGL
jgi:hypothetical protein